MKAALDDGYTMCVDLTAVDYSAHPGRALPDGIEPERFEVVVNLLDLAAARRLRLRVQVPGDDPDVPSLFDVHPGHRGDGARGRSTCSASRSPGTPTSPAS